MLNNTIKAIFTLAAFSFLVGVSDNVNAEIYKCVNSDGKTYYNDKTCPTSDEQTTLNNVKDPVGGYIPPAFVESDESQRSDGVVVGNSLASKKEKTGSNDISEDENLSNNNSGINSSGSNESSTDANKENVIESVNSNTTTKRIKNDVVSAEPLPTIPLRKEKVTKEPRSKLE